MKQGDGLLMREEGVLPPSARALLEKIGDEKITKVVAVRTPLTSFTKSFLNVISFGQFDKIAKKYYDELFHLSLWINDKYNLEKNEVIAFNTKNPISTNSQTRNIAVNKDITFNELIDKTKSSMGKANFSNYDAQSNNCQDFLLAILNSNGFGTAEDKAWIKQDTKQLFKEVPALSKILGKVATTIGASVDRLLQGEGGGRPRRVYKDAKGLYYKINGKKKYIKQRKGVSQSQQQLLNINIKNIVQGEKRAKRRKQRKRIATTKPVSEGMVAVKPAPSYQALPPPPRPPAFADPNLQSILNSVEEMRRYQLVDRAPVVVNVQPTPAIPAIENRTRRAPIVEDEVGSPWESATPVRATTARATTEPPARPTTGFFGRFRSPFTFGRNASVSPFPPAAAVESPINTPTPVSTSPNIRGTTSAQPTSNMETTAGLMEGIDVEEIKPIKTQINPDVIKSLVGSNNWAMYVTSKRDTKKGYRDNDITKKDILNIVEAFKNTKNELPVEATLNFGTIIQNANSGKKTLALNELKQTIDIIKKEWGSKSGRGAPEVPLTNALAFSDLGIKLNNTILFPDTDGYTPFVNAVSSRFLNIGEAPMTSTTLPTSTAGIKTEPPKEQPKKEEPQKPDVSGGCADCDGTCGQSGGVRDDLEISTIDRESKRYQKYKNLYRQNAQEIKRLEKMALQLMNHSEFGDIKEELDAIKNVVEKMRSQNSMIAKKLGYDERKSNPDDSFEANWKFPYEGRGYDSDEEVDGLYNDELEKLGKKVLKRVVPVISSDEIHTLLPDVSNKTKEFGFIMNTNPSDSDGSGNDGYPAGHWVCVYINNQDDFPSIEYFDPLGNAPTDETIEGLRKLSEKMDNDKLFLFKENLVKRQADNTNHCGHFCMDFLEQRFSGVPFVEATGFDKCMNQEKEGESEILKKVKLYENYL